MGCSCDMWDSVVICGNQLFLCGNQLLYVGFSSDRRDSTVDNKRL